MSSELSLVQALLENYARKAVDRDDLTACERTQQFLLDHPDCLHRSCLSGHLTGSAWILDEGRTRTLLTHHRKLGKWLQLGGHADGDPDLAAVALREAKEESGLESIRLLGPDLFDLDIHIIPARRDVPEHLHLDFRFVIKADAQTTVVVSDESLDLAWVPLETVHQLNPEESMLRMVRKSKSLG